jgi:Xaa-Pro aminopeptidase
MARASIAGILVLVALTAASAGSRSGAGSAAPSPGTGDGDSAGFAQGRVLDAPPAVLPVRERPAAINAALRERLDTVLPHVMRETGVDLWLVIAREYVEDPVYFTLVPAPSFAARRTTMLVFHDRGPEHGVERWTVSRYPLADLYQSAWEGGDLDAQWQRLGELIRERDPRTIAIDVSRDWQHADGLTHGLHRRLMEVLSPELRERVVSAEALVVRWLETRAPLELEVYPQAVAVARRVIAEAFSERVVTPGVTTTDDVAWYIRERFHELDLDPWFHPYVNVQRPGQECGGETPFCGEEPAVIRRGDVLHTDVGLCYLRLCTDTQEMGYVLRIGESEVPAGLRRALAVGNRWQDLVTAEFRTGRPGNEVLAAARAAADADGIVSSLYTHPIGFHGHAAGATVGMWDNQGPTPVEGDWPIHPDTAWAIEGNVVVPVPEWEGGRVQIKLEQSAVFDGRKVLYLAGRQTEWHVIR